VKLSFHGAVRTTTGSRHLLEVNGTRLLLDCGLYQGKRQESIERNQQFPFDPKSVDAVILSHAHIDHIGNLPNLHKQGFEGNVYCTFATRDLAAIMLEDSAQIQVADAAYISKKHKKKGLPPVEPLYLPEDAESAVRQFVSLGYERPIPVANGVTLTFRDAGHILGSAQVILDIDEGGTKRRLLFSGDIGRGDHAILRDPQPVEDVDVLLVESTYGNREHTAQSGLSDEVEALLAGTLNNGGKVIIPAFSVGRTQLLVYTLHQLVDAGRLPDFPIYVDSPLSVNATEVFRLHSECFNSDIYTFLREKENPFGMDNLTYIRKASESIKLGGTHPASLEEQYQRPERPHPVCRLLRLQHTGLGDPRRYRSSLHLRRTSRSKGQNRQLRRILRTRRQKRAGRLRKKPHWRYQTNLRRPRRRELEPGLRRHPAPTKAKRGCHCAGVKRNV